MALIAIAAQFHPGVSSSAAPAGIAGDYNDSGTVDALDYTVWRDRLGQPSSMPNDSTLGVNHADYDVWKANFGRSQGGGGAIAELSASGGVPEPASWILAAFTLLFVSLRRPRR